MLLRSVSAMLVLLAIGFATEVCAQYPGGQGGTGGPGGSRGGMGAGRGGPPPESVRSGSAQEAPLSPGAFVQIQLDQLEDDLRLAPAQVGAWRIYADRRLPLVVTLLATGVTPAGMMDNSSSRGARRPPP